MLAECSVTASRSGGGSFGSESSGPFFVWSVTAAIMPASTPARVGAMGRVDVELLGEGDLEAATAASQLLGRELGQGLYPPEWLLEDAASPTAVVWLAGDSALMGAAVARMLTPADAD